MIMERCDADLSTVIPRLSLESKLSVSRQVARAMLYLHTRKPPVLFRDLKPSNVLINRDGRCKVADFGVSRLLQEGTMTRNAGTLMYMANEVLNGGRYGRAADVWSFGLLLVEVWTGRPPYDPYEPEW